MNFNYFSLMMQLCASFAELMYLTHSSIVYLVVVELQVGYNIFFIVECGGGGGGADVATTNRAIATRPAGA